MANKVKRPSKNSTRLRVSRIQSQRAKLPPQVKNLITANGVIDLSTASDFYKKKAEVTALLDGFVEQLPDFRYRIRNGFDSWFLNSLPLFLRNGSGEPANILAEALFQLGRHWAKIDYGDLPIGNSKLWDQLLLETWKSVEPEWEAFCASGGPIGSAWSYTLEDGGTLGPSSDENPRQVKMWITFATTKRGAPPTMVIQVAGEAAVTLMRLWMRLKRAPSSAQPDAGDLRQSAEATLDSIVRKVKVNLGLGRPHKGRPSIDIGGRIAYLLDHENKSIKSVAAELGQLPPPGLARRKCFDRLKKAAKNFYAGLYKDFQALIPVKSE
jgi:hypothetical protein